MLTTFIHIVLCFLVIRLLAWLLCWDIALEMILEWQFKKARNLYFCLAALRLELRLLIRLVVVLNRGDAPLVARLLSVVVAYGSVYPDSMGREIFCKLLDCYEDLRKR